MANREKIMKAIYGAVDEINRKLPKAVQLEKSPETILYGKSSAFETSLDFVEFIMEVEEKIKEDFNLEIAIRVDDDLISKENSPFTTLGSLTDYLESLLPREIG
ncbi:MAG: hypothetical protein H0U60_18165 [Blastocatellia bacterium]|nr:hypothetical protein [Blastocatellia bacterium]